jgi:hypothetical protein
MPAVGSGVTRAEVGSVAGSGRVVRWAAIGQVGSVESVMPMSGASGRVSARCDRLSGRSLGHEGRGRVGSVRLRSQFYQLE